MRTSEGLFSMKRFTAPATHPINFAADSPDEIIAALRERYFSFDIDQLAIWTFISSVLCREDSKERRNARWHTTLLAKSRVLHLGSG